LGVVFDLFVDPAHLAKWFPRALRLAEVSGSLDQVGTTYTLIFAPPARAFCEVVGVERPLLHERTFLLSFGIFSRLFSPIPGRVKMEFQAEGDARTRLTLTCHYTPPSGLGRRAVKRMMERQVADELKRFPAHVERVASSQRDILPSGGLSGGGRRRAVGV
jgi:hypothetical protein